jgi:hypothetical protein
MAEGAESQDWGTLVPAEDHGQSSVLINEGWAAARGPTSYHVWRPPGDVLEELPPGFGLPLRCHVGPDGHRRFTLVGTPDKPDDAVAAMWAGGFALLCRVKRPSDAERFTYGMMWFLYQRVLRMREHQRRSFRWLKDFHISQAGRSSPGDDSLVPTVLKGRKGEMRRPPAKYLYKVGLEAAEAAGIPDPTPGQVVHHGLVALARQDPLPRPDDRVQKLVRDSLFESGPSDQEPDPEILELVYERVCEAFEAHTVDPAAKFNAWFWDRNNTFVKQIAKKERARGGPLDPELVRRALLQLGWDAYGYMAGCLSLQMQAVAGALPDPLTPPERAIFEQMHLPQPHFGGLPLILLGERLGFVESVAWEICENPGDSRPVEVLHRLLQCYATMAPDRREADRKRKRRVPLEYDGERDSPQEQGPDLFDVIAAHILTVKNKSCGCADPEWVASVEDHEAEPITFRATCNRCNACREVTLSRQEFADLGREFFPPMTEGA